MNEKIFFFHNPKAGGSSLTHLMRSRIPAENCCPLIENDAVQHDALSGDYSGCRGYQVYAGHYGYDIFSAVNDGHCCITNFRHPALRLISLYNFFRYTVNLPDEDLYSERFFAVLFAKTVDFRAFMLTDDPRVEVYVRNAHYRQLTNSCWSLELKDSLADACRLICDMPWYYICEYPELSLHWMRRVFRWEQATLPWENVGGDRGGRALRLSDIGSDIIDLIRAKNELDIEIYRYAVDHFLRVA